MNKKYSQSLKWNVKFFDMNKHKIIDYNILEYKRKKFHDATIKFSKIDIENYIKKR